MSAAKATVAKATALATKFLASATEAAVNRHYHVNVKAIAGPVIRNFWSA